VGDQRCNATVRPSPSRALSIAWASRAASCLAADADVTLIPAHTALQVSFAILHANVHGGVKRMTSAYSVRGGARREKHIGGLILMTDLRPG
jgi:hypothetical protein